MKTILAFLFLAACGGDGGSSGAPDASSCSAPPASCAARCQTNLEHFGPGDCCDSITCNCVPSTEQWEIFSCDPPPAPDAGPDAAQ